MNDYYMTIPSITDVTFASIIADRILIKENLQELRDSPDSKYFKNIVIKDVPWGEITQIPSNFPQEFLEKYPNDYRAYFSVLGCNSLKCYKHNYQNEEKEEREESCREKGPFLINNKIFGCSEACYGIYREFNHFLKRKFSLPDEVEEKENSGEFSFETFSIRDPKVHVVEEEDSECYCCMQLHDMKRYAILPSSRWNDPDESSNLTAQEYYEKFKNHPMKLADMAGLVDAPPLDWDVGNQNVNFNSKYCQRFRKVYDRDSDSCYEKFHRTALGYLVGESVVKQFSDVDFYSMLALHGLPLDMLLNKSKNDQMNINVKYSEVPISQAKLEKHLFTPSADKIIDEEKGEYAYCANMKASLPIPINAVLYKGSEVNNLIVETLREMGKDVAIEMAVVNTPLIMSHLLKTFSESFLKSVLLKGASGSSVIPITTRISTLLMASIIKHSVINVTARLLLMASSALNVVFSVGIITLIPDILLRMYNIGGFNNEISREGLESMRKALNAHMLSYIAEDFDTSLPYVIMGNKDDQHDRQFASPLITPEFVYNNCIIHFVSTYPHLKEAIGFNGTQPERFMEVTSEYLSLLKVNSLGQKIGVEIPDNSTRSITTTTVDQYIRQNEEMEKELQKILNKNVFTDLIENKSQYMASIIQSDTDLYVLYLGLILFTWLVINVISNNRYNTFNIVLFLMTLSISCFAIWFYMVDSTLLYMQKANKRPLFI